MRYKKVKIKASSLLVGNLYCLPCSSNVNICLEPELMYNHLRDEDIVYLLEPIVEVTKTIPLPSTIKVKGVLLFLQEDFTYRSKLREGWVVYWGPEKQFGFKLKHPKGHVGYSGSGYEILGECVHEMECLIESIQEFIGS